MRSCSRQRPEDLHECNRMRVRGSISTPHGGFEEKMATKEWINFEYPSNLTHSMADGGLATRCSRHLASEMNA